MATHAQTLILVEKPSVGRDLPPDGRIEGREGLTVGGMISVHDEHVIASLTQGSGSDYQSSESQEAFAFVKRMRGISPVRDPMPARCHPLVGERFTPSPRHRKPGAASEYPKRLLVAQWGDGPSLGCLSSSGLPVSDAAVVPSTLTGVCQGQNPRLGVTYRIVCKSAREVMPTNGSH